MEFNNDGTKMFVLGYNGNDVNEYDLSPAFDISTGSFVGASPTPGQAGNILGIAFNKDGTKMYVIGNGDKRITEFDLGTVESGDGVLSNNLTVLAGGDVDPPSVFNLVPVANTPYNVSTTIEIGANITDNIAVSAVLANVTLPNGTINQLILTNTSNFYNTSFTIPNLVGQYNVTFIANDTSNNINSTETTFFVGNDNIAPTIGFISPTPANGSAQTNTDIFCKHLFKRYSKRSLHFLRF